MKKLIYPLNYNCRELLRSYNKSDEFLFVVKDNTKSYYQKLANLYGSEIKISSDFEECLREVDMIIFVGGSHLSDYIEKIAIAKKHGKYICTTRNIYQSLSENKMSHGVKLLEEQATPNSDGIQEILDINVPIIAVMGLGKYCDKFNCELYLRDFYLSLGYKVLQFGSKEIAPLFGFSSIPEFVIDSTLSVKDRVIMFNRYIIDKIQEEKPDIIIMGIPEGIIPLSKSLHNNFGEMAFIISNAVTIDYTIMGVYYDEIISTDFVQHISNCIAYKYNSELLGICVSNTAYEPSTEVMGMDAKYYHMEIDGDFKYKVEYPVTYCNVNRELEMKHIAEKSYNMLTQNPGVIM